MNECRDSCDSGFMKKKILLVLYEVPVTVVFCKIELFCANSVSFKMHFYAHECEL